MSFFTKGYITFEPVKMQYDIIGHDSVSIMNYLLTSVKLIEKNSAVIRLSLDLLTDLGSLIECNFLKTFRTFSRSENHEKWLGKYCWVWVHRHWANYYIDTELSFPHSRNSHGNCLCNYFIKKLTYLSLFNVSSHLDRSAKIVKICSDMSTAVQLYSCIQYV